MSCRCSFPSSWGSVQPNDQSSTTGPGNGLILALVLAPCQDLCHRSHISILGWSCVRHSGMDPEANWLAGFDAQNLTLTTRLLGDFVLFQDVSTVEMVQRWGTKGPTYWGFRDRLRWLGKSIRINEAWLTGKYGAGVNCSFHWSG